MIALVDIGPENWRPDLRVSEEQKAYVSDSVGILARAYAYRKDRSRAFLVCKDDVPVGMGLYHDLPEISCYDFSQLFIDERFQGRGYGKAAVNLVLEELRRDGRYGRVVLCYVEGNSTAKRMYRQFGFVETDRDGNEIVMELTI